jgi:hypothetical protein
MPTTTDTISNANANATRTSAESRPITPSDAATRGESRGAARMNTIAPDNSTSTFRWQADGEG